MTQSVAIISPGMDKSFQFPNLSYASSKRGVSDMVLCSFSGFSHDTDGQKSRRTFHIPKSERGEDFLVSGYSD
jgi:hypothetical protein